MSTACLSLAIGLVACGGDRPKIVAAPRNSSSLVHKAESLNEPDSSAVSADAGSRELEAQSEDAALLIDASLQLSLLDAGPVGEPIAIAARFMDAIRHKRQEVLLSLAALPFHLRDSGAAVSCKDGGSAAQREELAKLLSCLITDDLLAEELQANPQPETTVLRPRDIPSWARRFRKALTPRRTPVMIYVPGNGVTFYFVVVVEDSAVHELWKHAEFDSN
jgi:hypothetical protein